MGKELTERTQRRIELIDSHDTRAQVTALFEAEAALYGSPNVEVLERVRFAVIRLPLQGPTPAESYLTAPLPPESR